MSATRYRDDVGRPERPYKHVDPELVASGRATETSERRPSAVRRNRSTRSGGTPPLDEPVSVKEVRRRGQRRPYGPRAGAAGPLAPAAGARADADAGARDGALRGARTVLVSARPGGQLRARATARRRGSARPTGLCFIGRHPDSGRRFELVTLPDGCAFDLLGISR